MKLQELFHSSINLLLPTPCETCGRGLAFYPLPICQKCRDLILDGRALPVRRSDKLRKIWSCRSYEGAIRDCIRNFKYGGRSQLVSLFEDLTRKFLAENNISTGITDLVIPVPLHPVRRHKRGFNQSELIAYILSGLLSSPVSTHTLIKTKNTEPQMGLSMGKRVVNLKNSFAAVDRMRLTGRSVMLVDDIMTTGATLNTCAKELLRSGAREVYAFTLARTL